MDSASPRSARAAPKPSSSCRTGRRLLSPAAAAAVLTPAPPARVVVGPTTGTAPPATAAGAPASTRPLTGEEKKALERSPKQDEVRKAIEAKEQLKRDEADRRTEQAEQ